MSSLLQRIATYFTEWDGDEETAPKIICDINDLRCISDMNVQRCRLEAKTRIQRDKEITLRKKLTECVREIESLNDGKETALTQEIKAMIEIDKE